MTKGTPSFGKHQRTSHIRCRRCGRHSYNKTKGFCTSCGFGKTKKIRKESWKTKLFSRKRKK